MPTPSGYFFADGAYWRTFDGAGPFTFDGVNMIFSGEVQGGSTIVTDTTTTAGIAYPSADWRQTIYQPAGTPNQSIRFASMSRFDWDTTYSNSGIGHVGARVDWLRILQNGNINYGLAQEAKVEVVGTGTYTSLKGHESQLSDVAAGASIGLYTGATAQIVNNAGAITTAVGMNVDVAANSGTIGTWFGFLHSDISGRSGITSRFALKNLDPGAPVHSLGPIVDGAVVRAAPASGANVAIYNGTTKQAATRLELQHGATIAALTITLPSASQIQDGHTLKIVALNNVTALTWAGGTGGSRAVVGALVTSITGYATIRLWYSAATDLWYVD